MRAWAKRQDPRFRLMAPAVPRPVRSVAARRTAASARSGALLLPLVCSVQFMVIADGSIVNVALPRIHEALGFTEQGLSWVPDAYFVIFGGFLLVGGRAADVFSRRRLFALGAFAFAVMSGICGLAPNGTVLVIARGAQGLAAAMLEPAALAILLAAYPEGPRRTRALGVWGALLGLGAATGVLLGGLLTDLAGWRWVFAVNVPIGLAVGALATAVIPADGRRSHLRLNLVSAVLATAGLLLILDVLVEIPSVGWGSSRTIAESASAAALLGGFMLTEWHSTSPLLPVAALRRRAGALALGLLLLVGAGMYALFFFVSLYLQGVRGMSPLVAGLAWLPFSVTMIIVSGLVMLVMPGRRLRPFLLVGAATLTGGFLLLTLLEVRSSYVDQFLPTILLMAAASGVLLVPLTTAATSGIGSGDEGLASGLISTFQQVGAAAGIAALVSIASSRTAHLMAQGRAAQPATLAGFHLAFGAAAILTAAAAVVAGLLGPIRAPAKAPGETVGIRASAAARKSRSS